MISESRLVDCQSFSHLKKNIPAKKEPEDLIEKVRIKVFDRSYGLTNGQLYDCLSSKKWECTPRWSDEFSEIFSLGIFGMTSIMSLVFFGNFLKKREYMPEEPNSRILLLGNLAIDCLAIGIGIGYGCNKLLNKLSQYLGRKKYEAEVRPINQIPVQSQRGCLAKEETLVACFRKLPMELRPYELSLKLSAWQVSHISQDSKIIKNLPLHYQKIWNLINQKDQSEEDALKLCKKIEKLIHKRKIYPTDPADFLTIFIQKWKKSRFTLDVKRYCIGLINQICQAQLLHLSQFDQVCDFLKYNPNTILEEAVFQLHKTSINKDLTLRINGQEYQVFSEALITQSDFFRSLFSSNWKKEEQEDINELKDINVSADIIEKFFKILHGEYVSFVPQEDQSIFILCDRFLTPMLTKSCLDECIKAIQQDQLQYKPFMFFLSQYAPTVFAIFLNEYLKKIKNKIT